MHDMDQVPSRGASTRHARCAARRASGGDGILGRELTEASPLSFIILALPEDVGPGPAAIAQLLGPNLCTVLGAVLGGLFGRMRRRPPSPWYARAAESPGAIVVAVRASDAEQARDIAQLLTESGGREPRTEPRTGRRR